MYYSPCRNFNKHLFRNLYDLLRIIYKKDGQVLKIIQKLQADQGLTKQYLQKLKLLKKIQRNSSLLNEKIVQLRVQYDRICPSFANLSYVLTIMFRIYQNTNKQILLKKMITGIKKRLKSKFCNTDFKRSVYHILIHLAEYLINRNQNKEMYIMSKQTFRWLLKIFIQQNQNNRGSRSAQASKFQSVFQQILNFIGNNSLSQEITQFDKEREDHLIESIIGDNNINSQFKQQKKLVNEIILRENQNQKKQLKNQQFFQGNEVIREQKIEKKIEIQPCIESEQMNELYQVKYQVELTQINQDDFKCKEDMSIFQKNLIEDSSNWSMQRSDISFFQVQNIWFEQKYQ